MDTMYATLSSAQSLDSIADITMKATIRKEFECCVRCGEKAGFRCERCGDCYCSVECQTVDWSLHRPVCFPMPKLIRARSISTVQLDSALALDIKSKVEKLPPVSDGLQSGAEVELVYASNHYSAYVRSTDSDGEYYDLLDRVFDSSAHANKSNELPMRGDIVAAPFCGEYYRAVVLEAESREQPIHVVFLDYGNVDAVKFEDLRDMENDLKKAKRFTFRILFDGVDREKSNLEALKLLKSEEGTLFTIHCSPDSPTVVENSIVRLINAKTKECLNDKLVSTQASAVEEARATPRSWDQLSRPPAEPASIRISPPEARYNRKNAMLELIVISFFTLCFVLAFAVNVWIADQK